MFGSHKGTLYEGVWKIENVEGIGDNEVLVKFKTAFYTSETEAKDPQKIQPYEVGPVGKSIQTVTLNKDKLPTVEDFNTGNRHKLYKVLTEELDFETKMA